jgi:DNA ligase-1
MQTTDLKRAMLVSLSMLAPVVSAMHAPPPVMLANSYDPGTIELADYWISEKYDGVRAWWNGSELLTRSGHRIHAPTWFTANWPAAPLDGELWIGRGLFDLVSGIVRREQAGDEQWRRVRYMVFDLPAHDGSFDVRLATLQQRVRAIDQPWVQCVEQMRIADHARLTARLDQIVRAGGEGLMLHRGSSSYAADRNNDLLKLKSYEDAEAQVIGYLPGKGKYVGLVGALRVQGRDGLQFSIGSGLTDSLRQHPPAIGSWVTYGFHGRTATGKPRFARYVRNRESEH